MASAAEPQCGIDVPASKVWEFFYRNKTRLSKEQCLLAYDEKTGAEIYLTSCNGYPMIIVEKYNSLYLQGVCSSPSDCESSVKELYDTHISVPENTQADDAGEEKDNVAFDDYCIPDEVIENAQSSDDDDDDCQDPIAEREAELESALEDFLWAVFDDRSILKDEDFKSMEQDILDAVMDAVASFGYGDSMYRPLMIGDELLEYPYA